jgi:hypothetical protein
LPATPKKFKISAKNLSFFYLFKTNNLLTKQL